MKQNPMEQQINNLIRPVVQDLGFDVVQVKFKSDVLEILAENPQDGKIGVDECANVSRAISTVMDGLSEDRDPIKGAYRLEVSSPGIDRPLTRAQDFERYAGFETKIELDTPDEKGQKRFSGVLKGLQDQNAVLQTEDGDKEFELAAIVKARLVMTDALMEASKNGDIPKKVGS